MSKVFIEEETLIGIGNAIREKSGTTDLIATTDMATAISNLATGGGETEIPPIYYTCRARYNDQIYAVPTSGYSQLDFDYEYYAPASNTPTLYASVAQTATVPKNPSNSSSPEWLSPLRFNEKEFINTNKSVVSTHYSYPLSEGYDYVIFKVSNTSSSTASLRGCFRIFNITLS